MDRVAITNGDLFAAFAGLRRVLEQLPSDVALEQDLRVRTTAVGVDLDALAERRGLTR